MSVDNHAIEQALARGAGQQIGQYRVDLSTGTWWWSPQTYRMHGFEPGEVVPTTELVLAHKHPRDRDRVRGILEDARRTGDPFSSVHRIMDAHGTERILVIVGQGRRDRDTDEVVELMGYFIDITTTVVVQANERAEHDIAAAAEGRGPIEQAKGILIVTHGLSSDEAFARLRRTSNDRNIALRELARLVVDEAQRAGGDCAERVAALLD